MSRLRDWIDERTGMGEILDFLRHKEVPRHSQTIWYYFGGATLVLFLLQVVSGLLLLLYYQPTLEAAHPSVQRLMTDIPMGWLIRSLHHWSAHFMIALMFVHLLSTLFLKAYRPPRELTWISGSLLALLTLMFGFTGYLLPWDDLSLAATKVGTDIPRALPIVGPWITQLLRGGQEVTADTLSRFFALHVGYLPALLLIVVGFHVFLVQRQGMSAQDPGVDSFPFYPNFLYRECIAWLLLLGVLVTLAALFPASLGEEADLMGATPEGIKPEWYFLGFFQFLKLLPSRFLLIPGDTLAVSLGLLLGIGFLGLPLVDTGDRPRVNVAIMWLAVSLLGVSVILSVWGFLA